MHRIPVSDHGERPAGGRGGLDRGGGDLLAGRRGHHARGAPPDGLPPEADRRARPAGPLADHRRQDPAGRRQQGERGLRGHRDARKSGMDGGSIIHNHKGCLQGGWPKKQM